MPRNKQDTGAVRSRWFALVWIVPTLIVLLAAAVLASQWFVDSPTGQRFLGNYSGHSQATFAATGFPGWLQWQHFLNLFFIVLIVRSGWRVRTDRKPEAYWTRTVGPKLESPTKISLYLWLHYALDVFWVLNGFIFYILLFGSGHWRRILPTNWDIFPHALSAGLQYLSLDWPMETAWTNYNALQVLAYFVTVFIAAPLAIITGLRMSALWSAQWKINRIYPMELARLLHLPTMFYFVAFTVAHVALVFVTGMRANLNNMFSWAGEGSTSWLGFGIFLVAMLVLVVGWIAARPLFMSSVARPTGKVTSR